MNLKQKGRHWAFVMYPESMPEDWYDILQKTGLSFAISPLHDKDINPTGELKKPHYHVLFSYDNPTTLKNVKENVCDIVNGTIPIKLENLKGMYRYHIHLDNPEKYQYDDRDRIFINDFDISEVSKLTETEIDRLKLEIQNLIETEDIKDYCKLMVRLSIDSCFELWRIASRNVVFFKSFIDSRRNVSRETYIDNRK